MRHIFPTFVVAVLAAVYAGAQVPTPSPTPAETDVVKISTNLIQIDVTVVDSKGKIVRDLRQDEIEIYENGQKQKISGFTFVSSTRETTEKRTIDKIANKTAVPIPQVELRPENVRRTISLIVDDLSLSFESAYYTRRALKKFVDEQMLDGDLVAIIRTSAGTGALQQFTSDKRILYAAIERVKWYPVGNGGISAFAPLQAVVSKPPDETEPEPGERTAEGVEREFNDFRESYFAGGTLGAINYVVRGMSELPGRKSIILFSDGFSLSNVDAAGSIQGSPILESLRRLVEAANRASVVVYAVDPRGLQYAGLTAADDTSGRTIQQVETEMSGRRDKLLDTQDGLRYLSRETGGFAVVNSNDLSGGVRRILEDQSYYLIAYEPDADTFDPVKRKFNKLAVKVTRDGASARYRSGFFNVADKTAPVAATKATPIQQLQNALMSPFAVNDISLRLNALFGRDPSTGVFVRSLLHIEARDLKFVDEADGTKKAVFDVWAAAFGDNGVPVEQLGKSYTLTVKPENYKKILDEGFIYHFTFPVKKAGAYQYRVAIRDTQGEKAGSASQFIDVPNLKKGRITASSIVLENLTPNEWDKLNGPGGAVARSVNMDTAVRRVRKGTILRYGYEIYNARLDASKKPKLQIKVRIFRDGNLILDGQPTALDMTNQTEVQRLKAAGAMSIGDQMPPGDYILQVIVIDELAKVKDQVATQIVQFEVVQ